MCLTVRDQIAAEAPHKYSLRSEAHTCTKCVNVFSKPTAYIGFQLHKMLEEFKPKVTTHSPHAHRVQQALPVMSMNIVPQILFVFVFVPFLQFKYIQIFIRRFLDICL